MCKKHNYLSICQNPKCNKEFIVKPSTRGKYCSLSCSSSYETILIMNKKIITYNKNPKRCLQCNNTLEYKKRTNKYCSNSCSATFNSNKRNYTIFKPGPKKGPKLPQTKDFKYSKYNNGEPYTPIKQCIICQKFHPNLGKTCSNECYLKLLSIKIRESINNGFNPQKNRGRGKQSYLEKSFEDWIKKEFPYLEYIKEYKFSRLDTLKSYFGDFYFPTLNLVIELDGIQHLKTQEYDQERDEYIQKTYNVEIIRISHKEYKNKTKLELIRNKLKL